MTNPADIVGVDPSTPQVSALRAAGLIQAEATSRHGSISYAPTAAARPFIEETASVGGIRMRRLCYAQREVARVWVKPRNGRRDTPTLVYAFRLTHAPAWASRTDIRAAYPWLNDAYALEHVSPDVILFEDGRWKVSFRAPDLQDRRIHKDWFAGFPLDKTP